MKRILPMVMMFLIVLAGCSSGKEDIRKLSEMDRKLQGGDYYYVIQHGEEYVREYPESYKAWNMLGWAYADDNQDDRALECFDKALSLNEKADNALVGKGVLCRKAGDLEGARENYIRAIDIQPKNAEAYTSLLVIELLEGNDELAVEYGEKAWSLRKNLPAIPANLSLAYHYIGNIEKRDKFYEEARKLGYDKLDTLKAVFDGEASIR